MIDTLTSTLTLTSIDAQRHIITSEQVVKAIGFAVRAGHSNRTAYRFVTALSMAGTLDDRSNWPKILLHVFELELKQREEDKE